LTQRALIFKIIFCARNRFANKKMKKKPLYKRVVIKLSGESFAGEQKSGLNHFVLKRIADQIVKITKIGVSVGIVVGGGNFWRGKQGDELGINRATSDYMGMLSTVINALALQSVLEAKKIETRVLTAIEIREIAEPFIIRRAIRHLEKGRVLIFAAGTGNPFFSTDTAAALRAIQIEADALLMAKNKTDGIYSADPNIEVKAQKYEEISCTEILSKALKALDSTAVSLSRDHKLKIIVFNVDDPQNIAKVVVGEKIGTNIHSI